MKSTGWALLIVALGVATGVFLSRKPWQDYFEQRSVSKAAAQEMREAEGERAELARQSSLAESPSGREATARERGYRRRDETPVENVK
jgi:hypothetical protein